MTSPKVVFCLICLLLGKIAQVTGMKLSSSVLQKSDFLSFNVGDVVTLECFEENDVVARFYWYKLAPGQKPRLISIFYKYERSGTFYNEFKNNPRFRLDTENDQNNLVISDLHFSDSATYYCASSYTFILEFIEGTILSVKGSGLNIPALVHQSASESIQPGGSVTLNCTVHTGTCDDGEHSVYWFKKSEESHPGIIYTHGGRNDQCERNSSTQTHTCVYNLPMKNLNLSHAGTYYCAVASCGHILFGNGTKLDFEHEVDCLVSVNVWIAASAFTTILCVILAILACMMNKSNCSICADSEARFSAASKKNAEGYQNGDNLEINRSRSQRDDTWSECVYFSVKE